MQGNIKFSIIMAFCCALSFILISDSVFPFIAAIFKGILIIAGIVCAWASVHHFSRYLKAYNLKKKQTVYNLIFRSGIKSAIVNILTVYRIAISPVLLVLLFNDNPAFKWLLLSAFLTDALDGFLARRLKVTSSLGAKLDSLADDFLFTVSLISIIYLHASIFIDNIVIIAGMIFTLLIKMLFLWFKHGKIISGMHTYLTKAAAFLQAVFFIYSVFYQPDIVLFYATTITTLVAMIEELIIILSSRELKQNVKGLFF